MSIIDELFREALVLTPTMITLTLKATFFVWGGVAALLVSRWVLGLRFTTAPVHFGTWLTGALVLALSCLWAMSSVLTYASSPRAEDLFFFGIRFWLVVLAGGLPIFFGGAICAHTLSALKASGERAERAKQSKSEGVAK